MGNNKIKSESADLSTQNPPNKVESIRQDISTSPSIEEFERVKKNLTELRDDFRREKSNNLVVFGIFASLIGFLSIEVKLFSSVTEPLVILGVSLFFLGALGLFLLLLTHISNIDPKNENLNQKLINSFFNPVFYMTLICLILGTLLVIYSTSLINKNNTKIINIFI
jgi:hypothetical protein